MSSVIIAGDTSGTITLAAPAVAGSTTLTLPATSGTILQSGTAVTEAQGGTGTTTGYYGFKSRIINGAMVLDQRNAGASVSATNAVAYTVDRFYAIQAIAASKFTIQQSSTAATGFTKSVVLTSSSAYTVLASDYFLYRQVIEGFNVADLGWGAAGAQTITLSFWVRSSLTGTFGGSLSNGGSNRSYPFSYTINTANTYEQKTITIAGDTAGTWATDNSAGIVVNWSLGMGSTYTGTVNTWVGSFLGAPTGSTNLVSTNAATLYITGVQLEKGSTATSFDYRPYGTELALCQRYYYQTLGTTGNSEPSYYFYSLTTGQAYTAQYRFAVPMRVAPTTTTSGTWTTQNITGPTFVTDANSYMAVATLTTGGYAYFLSNASGIVKFNSEL